jgi:CheY-like chemotaxis protein
MKVFLSSTFQDLVHHREKAAQAIERLGQQGIRMEVFGARSLEAKAVCFEEIEASDAFIGIYAHRYGYVPSGQPKSITELEFDLARDCKKPMLCFVVVEDFPWPPTYIEEGAGRASLRAFKDRIRSLTVTDEFTSPEDLAFKVASSLGRFLLIRKVKEELERIPQRDAVSTEQGRSQIARRMARGQALLRGARILLVNDVPRQMSVVIGMLRDLSVEVDVATSSDEALRLLSSNAYEVIISDVQRDGVEDEGLRFLARARAAGLQIPVIFTLARLDPARGTPPFAFGITNRIDEMLNLVCDALERVRG